ncbi:hypothetical protein JOM56_001657 [Amanita muscaria]
MSYKCNNCNKSFDTDQSILAHCRSKGHSCNRCRLCSNERMFRSKQSLDQHQKAYHEYCNNCERAFIDDEALNQHYRNSPAHRDTYCFHCERLFADNAGREQHYRNSPVHLATYCHQCKRHFGDGNARKDV